MWTVGDSSRILSTKNVYNALISTLDYPTVGGWKLNLWKWNIQLKIKLFIWLDGNQKVLTWDTLQRKGWEGPGICILCNIKSKDIDYLLIHYAFTKVVWDRVHILLNIKRLWKDASFYDFLSICSKDNTALIILVAHTCSDIWIERNK